MEIHQHAFKLELPDPPSTKGRMFIAGMSCAFGSGIGIANLVNFHGRHSWTTGSWILTCVSWIALIFGLTITTLSHFRLKRFKREFSAALVLNRQKIKEGLDEMWPDDPIQVARVM